MKVDTNVTRGIKDIVITGIINAFVIYVAITAYDYFVRGLGVFSLSTLLISIFITFVNYFIGGNYYYLYDKVNRRKS